MKAEVRMDLKTYFDSYRKDEIFPRETKASWISEWEVLKLESRTPTTRLSPQQLERLCNKPTLLYWAHSAHRGKARPMLPFGCIYKEWFRFHEDEPDIEFGHFFAYPISITSTGPTTIAGILEAHRYYCNQVSLILNKISSGKADGPYIRHRVNPQHFRLYPLCRAIIVVLDKITPDVELEPDGSIVLDKVSQKQSMIMILTGDISGLSAPISFESIRAPTLPLARDDIITDSPISAVRVSLAVAVQFIADLERRERAAFPDFRDHLFVDTSLCPSKIGDPLFRALTADEWADTIMQDAEKKGIDGVHETAEAVRRVKAEKRGERLAEVTPWQFYGRWK